MAEKEIRNFAMRDEKGNEISVFTGKAPRQAALEYNALAGQFNQEAVAIDFKTGTGCGILSLNRKPRSQCRRWAAS